MDAVEFKFKMIGKTPLLLHQDNIEFGDEIEAWRLAAENQKKAGKKKGDDRSPAWTWLGYLPFDPDTGEAAIPAHYLTSMLAAAGTQIPTGKGTKSYKEAACAAVFPLLDFFPLTTKGKPFNVAELTTQLHAEEDFRQHLVKVRAAGFDLDMRRAKVGAGKHVRVRPKFMQWEVTGDVRVELDRIPQDILTSVFRIMGDRGLGDFRPSCVRPGRFGMFGVELKKAK